MPLSGTVVEPFGFGRAVRLSHQRCTLNYDIVWGIDPSVPKAHAFQVQCRRRNIRRDIKVSTKDF